MAGGRPTPPMGDARRSCLHDLTGSTLASSGSGGARQLPLCIGARPPAELLGSLTNNGKAAFTPAESIYDDNHFCQKYARNRCSLSIRK